MNDINIELAKISEWLKANKLSLNVAKSKCMFFHHPLKKILTLLLKMNDTRIECVKCQ